MLAPVCVCCRPRLCDVFSVLFFSSFPICEFSQVVPVFVCFLISPDAMWFCRRGVFSVSLLIVGYLHMPCVSVICCSVALHVFFYSNIRYSHVFFFSTFHFISFHNFCCLLRCYISSHALFFRVCCSWPDLAQRHRVSFISVLVIRHNSYIPMGF